MDFNRPTHVPAAWKIQRAFWRAALQNHFLFTEHETERPHAHCYFRRQQLWQAAKNLAGDLQLLLQRANQQDFDGRSVFRCVEWFEKFVSFSVWPVNSLPNFWKKKTTIRAACQPIEAFHLVALRPFSSIGHLLYLYLSPGDGAAGWKRSILRPVSIKVF